MGALPRLPQNAGAPGGNLRPGCRCKPTAFFPAPGYSGGCPEGGEDAEQALFCGGTEFLHQRPAAGRHRKSGGEGAAALAASAGLGPGGRLCRGLPSPGAAASGRAALASGCAWGHGPGGLRPGWENRRGVRPADHGPGVCGECRRPGRRVAAAGMPGGGSAAGALRPGGPKDNPGGDFRGRHHRASPGAAGHRQPAPGSCHR